MGTSARRPHPRPLPPTFATSTPRGHRCRAGLTAPGLSGEDEEGKTSITQPITFPSAVLKPVELQNAAPRPDALRTGLSPSSSQLRRVSPLIFMPVSAECRGWIVIFFSCCFTDVTVSFYTTGEQWLLSGRTKKITFISFDVEFPVEALHKSGVLT